VCSQLNRHVRMKVAERRMKRTDVKQSSIVVIIIINFCCTYHTKNSGALPLYELHWLTKCGVPDYFCLLLTGDQPTRTLRSSDTELPYRPHTSSDFVSHSFASAAPTIWNSLSVTTRTANSIGTFRSRLKTDLFSKAYVT